MKRSQLAAQLYTVRDFCQNAKDLATTARKIRSIGYPAVQVSGIGSIPDDDVRRICDDAGLAICATHEPSERLLAEPERSVERLQRLGCRHTAYPFPRGIDFSSSAEVTRLIADLDRAGGVLAAAGLTLGYHNHAIEFVRLDGEIVLELIFARTRPAHVKAELDTYWVQYGGADPVAWCERLAGRMPVMHLKDYGFTTENKPAFAEIGRGNLDFARIIPAAEKAGCAWFVVEQDTCPGDPFESLRISFEHLVAHHVTG